MKYYLKTENSYLKIQTKRPLELQKRRDCEGHSKFTQVAHIKKITFEFSPHLISFGFHLSKTK